MKYKRLGDYIQLVDNRNTDLQCDNLLGVSIEKKFIKSIANVSTTDMTKYRVIERNQFAYSPVTSRNGDKLTVALLKECDQAILSPAYQVFEIKDWNKLIPEYLFIWFNRSEFDRYTRFNSWGSARETFDWETMCNVQLPIPDIEEQKKYVDIYKGLLNNQQAYEKSLDDLQLICDTKIQDLINKSELKPLGNYIQQSDERNTDLKITRLQGVSTAKKLINSKANTTGVNFARYKIVRTGQFVYVADTSRRGDKIALAMNWDKDCIVSAIYTVFEVVNEEVLLPEYLYLYFQRPEFDRYTRFHSWGSARETFDWNEMCRVKIPVPDIEVQKAIVTIYHTLQTRKRINEQLKDLIKPLCPVLMKGVMDEIVEKGREEAMV